MHGAHAKAWTNVVGAPHQDVRNSATTERTGDEDGVADRRPCASYPLKRKVRLGFIAGLVTRASPTTWANSRRERGRSSRP
eukprot:scaffold1401_cov330-Pavlova_lutheri.AAC.84